MLKKFVALPLLAAVGVGSSVGLASAAGTATSPTFKVCVNQAGVVFGATSKGRCPSGDRLLTIDPISLPGAGQRAGRAGGTCWQRRYKRRAGSAWSRWSRTGRTGGACWSCRGERPRWRPGPRRACGGRQPVGVRALHDHQRPRLGELRWHLALDDYTRTFIVDPTVTDVGSTYESSFTVTELFKGTFTTQAGAVQPNPTGGCSGSPATETGGVTGTMWGQYVIPIPAGADFNPYASFTLDPTLTGAQGTQAWLDAFFNNVTGGTTPGGGSVSSPLTGLNYAWEFYYNTPNNNASGSWADTDHGSSTGNITG